MGFIRGVITGVAVAAGAAAWYMSRAGEAFRNQYRVDRKLGALGDEIEERTREVRAKANAQVADMRSKRDDVADEVEAGLDEAQASAAEAAAEMAADVEARAAAVKKKASAASD